jgi:phenylalanyl-tRNA synthetase alpha chain
MNLIETKIQNLLTEFHQQLTSATTLEALEHVRVQFLGRNGQISEFVKDIKNFSPEDKKLWGGKFNQLKQESEQAFQDRLIILQQAHLQQLELAQKSFDVTSYVPNQARGSLHPCTLIVQKVENVFISMGYQIADGPELETDFYNFEALNIAPNHPARDMQDTFWVNLPGQLMRTQTSNVQIHTLQNQEPPVAILAPGRVYRSEATDASHDFVFKQFEGLLVGKDISMANLLATMQACLQAIFEKERLNIRVRPGFFPFVEPGVEIDMQCPFCEQGCSVCKRSCWIELCGAGLVHPNVLKAVGVDSQIYSGFAFGFGLTRLVMLYYGISDIRLLHSSKISFLEQF